MAGGLLRLNLQDGHPMMLSRGPGGVDLNVP